LPFKISHSEAHRLVKDLHQVSPSFYWTDLILTALVGWTAFIAAVVAPPFSSTMFVGVVVSVFVLYRGLSFLHEISHQTSRSLPGFEAGWNLLIGLPLLMPTFFYIGVHVDHHKISTYGTIEDPEYLPFAKSWLTTTLFALNALWIPFLLLIRFLLLTPVCWISPPIARRLVAHASSLTMNLRYRRQVTEELLRQVHRQSAVIWILWLSAVTFAVAGVLPWRIFALWFTVEALISCLNALRTLGAHAYESKGEPMDRTGQLLDSIDTPGMFWTELWAPVGLRYHALHHYFPGIPYHNLGEGYRRLARTLPVAPEYKKMTSRSLIHSLVTLFRKGMRRLHR
jgi:fatty acid desaturase